MYENKFYSKNVTEYHDVKFKSLESFNAIGLVVSSTP